MSKEKIEWRTLLFVGFKQYRARVKPLDFTLLRKHKVTIKQCNK